MTWGRLGWIAIAVAGIVLTGCGAPAPGTTTRLNPDEVPYGLLGESKPTQSTTTLPTSQPHRIWLVRDGELSPVLPVRAVSGDRLAQANDLLVGLLDGPTQAQHNEGYESALSTGVTATVREIDGETAQIQIRERRDGGRPAADGPLAVGQIILTVTSVPGIDSVLLNDGRQPLQAPLPGGALASRPVTADDYSSLVADTPTDAPDEAGADPAAQG